MRYWLISFLVLSSILFPFQNEPAHAADNILTADMINGESATLIDATTGTVLFEKNADVPMYPASITKIATGIFAIEKGKLDDLVTVSKKARYVEGTRVYLAEGEKVPLRKLLYGLLMHSGNDAAIAIAEHMAGSTEEFANQLNQFLQERVDIKKTHFTNPHGLHDPNHYTTASDMAKIARYAMFNPIFREIVSTKRLPWDGKEWKSELVNHNKMLWRYEGATGIKNGFTDQAHHTLVVSAKRGNSEFIAVTMKAASSNLAYSDVTKMLNFGIANFETVQVAKAGDQFKPDTATDNKEQHVEYYYTDKPLFVTVRKGTSISKKAASNSHLTIQENDAAQTSIALPLKKKEKPQLASAISMQPSWIVPGQRVPDYLIFIAWLTLNVLMVYYVVSKKRRNSIYERRISKRYDS